MAKTNLTVRIDQAVLEKARALGINLSEITENILKTESLVTNDEIITPLKLREIYKGVFLKLAEVLREWGTYVEVGFYEEESSYRDASGKNIFFHVERYLYLSPAGKLELCDDEGETIHMWDLSEDWPVGNLHESSKIISKLIESIYRTAEKNRNKLEDLTILKNILETLKKKREEDSSKIEGEKTK